MKSSLTGQDFYFVRRCRETGVQFRLKQIVESGMLMEITEQL